MLAAVVAAVVLAVLPCVWRFAFHLPFDRRADMSSCLKLKLWTELRVLSALFVSRIMSEFQHGPLHKQ